MDGEAEYCVYRFFSEDDELLYVGLTAHPGVRIAQHRRGKPWWAEVTSVTLQRCYTLEEAREVERVAIKREKPRYNIIHNVDPVIKGTTGLVMETAIQTAWAAVEELSKDQELADFVAGVVNTAMTHALSVFKENPSPERQSGSNAWEEAVSEADDWVASDMYKLRKGTWRAA